MRQLARKAGRSCLIAANMMSDFMKSEIIVLNVRRNLRGYLPLEGIIRSGALPDNLRSQAFNESAAVRER